MNKIHLRIITPKKIVREEDVTSVTVPSSEGEITVLPAHINLFSLLKDGIVKITKDDHEDFMAIGGGYLETNGKDVNVLVSRAHGQDEIDEKMTTHAIEEAKKTLTQAHTDEERSHAEAILRRSTIDMKLLRHRRHKPQGGV